MKTSLSSHLSISVQPGALLPYWVCGDSADEIGRHHACARDAEKAIHDYCRAHECTATVSVYTPRFTLWKKDEITADGSVASTTPQWLAASTKAP